MGGAPRAGAGIGIGSGEREGALLAAVAGIVRLDEWHCFHVSGEEQGAHIS